MAKAGDESIKDDGQLRLLEKRLKELRHVAVFFYRARARDKAKTEHCENQLAFCSMLEVGAVWLMPLFAW